MQPYNNESHNEESKVGAGVLKGPAFENWGHFDERESEQRKAAHRTRMVMPTILAVIFFCSLISLILGVPQSFAAQAMVTLPAYPGAQRISFRNGLDCAKTLDVYCHNCIYRTPDSPQQVIAYYEGLGRPDFLPPIQFVQEHGRDFDYLNANVCATFLGHRSCTEIAVFTSDGGTEIYHFEIGYPGEKAPASEDQ